MRYFLFSIIMHLMILVFAFETMKDKLEFKQVGNPKVSFTMIGTSKKISGLSQDLVLKKQTPKQEKKMTKKVTKKKNKEIKSKKKKSIKKNVDKKRKEISKDKKIEKISETKAISKPDVVQEKNEVSLDSTMETKTKIDSTDQNSQVKEIRSGFVKLADGSIAAKNQGVKGLNYGFLNQPEPKYPEIAKKMGFNKDITIKVRFLIGYNGHIEEIKFYDNIEKFGFRNEVKKALNQWRSTPITINGNKVKLYFYKKFKFEKN